ncbi:MAG TPA: N-6 DNA methylase [Thermoanaerobaculia bacterium]|nr:N-6 DNA methylase [Thermoanaerobaculia bacterium]
MGDVLGAVNRESELVAVARQLGAETVPAVAEPERALLAGVGGVSPSFAHRVANRIRSGHDPLGDAFCRLRTPADRRVSGATYTPQSIVASMIAWAKLNTAPVRIVDTGVGSGRFMLAAARAFRGAKLIGAETDPLAAVIARANLAAAGFADRAHILLSDYRSLSLPPVDGPTLFIGNPPYVRHHLISPDWKEWLTARAKDYGYAASQLAGLHVHFFLATAGLAKAGDAAVLITAGEWLDVNYGKLVRDLFLNELGGKSIHLIDPTAQPFPDAATTAAITTFDIGARPTSIRFKRIEKLASLGVLEGGRAVRRERVEAANRWTVFSRTIVKPPTGFVELGELCQVHRGQVTGANHIWIAGEHSAGLPDSVLFATVTKARELIGAGVALTDNAPLRRVIDLPVDLNELGAADRKRVDAFLRIAKQMGADKGFIATNRKAWWSVGLRRPAPILATYMARRSPAFVRNLADARHINIAHGIYPREPMPEHVLEALAETLGRTTSVQQGRTYAGGLTKFEPKEMERLLVPDPKILATTGLE